MRLGSMVLAILVVGWLGVPAGFSAEEKPLSANSFSIKTMRKVIDSTTKKTNSTTTKSELCAYQVEIVNRAFRDLKDLKVEYRVYKRDDNYGAKQSEKDLIYVSGEEEIELLENGRNFTFVTNSIQLDTSKLNANWRYTDGAKPEIKDRLYGLWMRIYSGGELVCDFQSTDVPKKLLEW